MLSIYDYFNRITTKEPNFDLIIGYILQGKFNKKISMYQPDKIYYQKVTLKVMRIVSVSQI